VITRKELDEAVKKAIELEYRPIPIYLNHQDMEIIEKWRERSTGQ